MARNIKKRLEALEGGRSKADQDEDEDGLRSEIAEAERQACLIAAWHQHHKLSVPIGSVLPDMLRYVDESEARRLLAMDYNSVYRAIGMPNHTAVAKAVPQAKLEERAMPQVQVPGWHRGR